MVFPVSHGDQGFHRKNDGGSCWVCFIALRSCDVILGQRGSESVWWRNPNFLEMLPPADPEEECCAPLEPEIVWIKCGLGKQTCSIHAKHGWVRSTLQKTDFVRNHKNLNIMKSSSGDVYMHKYDTACNETTPTISFEWFHDDFIFLTKSTSNSDRNCPQKSIKW